MNCPKCPPFDCEGAVSRFLTSGDQDAFRDLHDHFEGFILGTIRRRMDVSGDTDSHHDCLQEIFSVLGTKIHTWRREAPFCMWMKVVVNRRIIDWNIENRRRPRFHPLPPDIPAPVPDDLEGLDDCIRKRLGMLPQDHGQVFRLRYYEHRSISEIASLMDIPPWTVRYRLNLCLAKIRPCF
jgi:RNA polymerase sigma factor (sigma-70 family)